MEEYSTSGLLVFDGRDGDVIEIKNFFKILHKRRCHQIRIVNCHSVIISKLFLVGNEQWLMQQKNIILTLKILPD